MSRSAIITLVSVILLLIFAVQNAGVVSLTLFFWTFNMSLALMLLLIFLLGTGFGYFFRMMVQHRKNKALKNQE